jgi:hypothetical protein
MDDYLELVNEYIAKKKLDIMLSFYAKDLKGDGITRSVEEMAVKKEALEMSESIVIDILNEIERRTNGSQ